MVPVLDRLDQIQRSNQSIKDQIQLFVIGGIGGLMPEVFYIEFCQLLFEAMQNLLKMYVYNVTAIKMVVTVII